MAGNFVHKRKTDGAPMTPHIYSDGNYQFGPKKGDERRGDAEALREAIGKGEKIRVSADDGKRPSLVNTDIKRR